MLDAAFAPLTQHPAVRNARRLGMIWAWDVNPGRLPHFARRYTQHAMANGVLLRPIGQTVYAMPPYVMDKSPCSFWHAAHWRRLRPRWPKKKTPMAEAARRTLSLFVTGTDTGVGKTLASAALLHALAAAPCARGGHETGGGRHGAG
jgi:hypothetical protein